MCRQGTHSHREGRPSCHEGRPTCHEWTHSLREGVPSRRRGMQPGGDTPPSASRGAHLSAKHCRSRACPGPLPSLSLPAAFAFTARFRFRQPAGRDKPCPYSFTGRRVRGQPDDFARGRGVSTTRPPTRHSHTQTRCPQRRTTTVRLRLQRPSRRQCHRR